MVRHKVRRRPQFGTQFSGRGVSKQQRVHDRQPGGFTERGVDSSPLLQIINLNSH